MQSYSDVAQSNGIHADPADTIPKYYKVLIDALCQLSEVYYYQGNLDTAVSLLESNLHILTAGKAAPEDRVRFQTQRGRMLYYQGAIADTDSETALPVLLESQKLAQSLEAGNWLAKVLDLLGMIFYSQAFSNGNFETPREYFKRALELHKQQDDRQGMCESLFHLGLTYQNKDDRTPEDRQEALTYFHQANELAQAGGFKLEESYLVRHIAAEHQEDGDWKKAQAGFERSLALREAIGYKIYQPTALLTLGQFHQIRQEPDRALIYYQRACDLAEQMKIVMYIVRAQVALGDLEKVRGDTPAALQHYEIALQAANAADYQNGITQATARIEGLPQGS
jgi:tetratricopeptide (TPR) repeat protein